MYIKLVDYFNSSASSLEDKISLKVGTELLYTCPKTGNKTKVLFGSTTSIAGYISVTIPSQMHSVHIMSISDLSYDVNLDDFEINLRMFRVKERIILPTEKGDLIANSSDFIAILNNKIYLRRLIKDVKNPNSYLKLSISTDFIKANSAFFEKIT